MLNLLFLIIGFIILVYGATLLVDGASSLAKKYNVPDIVIGLTIVSIGTSLPELATSVVAAMKRNVDIAMGNIVGSNIFNVFFILGISAIINPVIVREESALDMYVNIGASLLLFLFIFTGKDRPDRGSSFSHTLCPLFGGCVVFNVELPVLLLSIKRPLIPASA